MMASTSEHIDFVGHLTGESARFARAISETDPDAAVPTCPDWNADDLLWHLGAVQWFWGSIVASGVTSTADAMRHRAEDRPVGRAALAEFFTEASRRLIDALAAAPPDTPAWTWADDHTVGFIGRRQAHEALIHRIDAELTARSRSAMDPRLSADGTDEALRIMYGGDLPPWGRFTPTAGCTLRVRATDTGDSWFLALGHFNGTDPDDGKVYDKPGIRVAAVDRDEPASATVSASAADLDCWLWHRPPLGPPERLGDPHVQRAFDSVIAAGIN